VLTVDGKPFYPLASWNGEPPEHAHKLGMNATFLQSPGSDESVALFRPKMRRYAELGMQVIPYISYGGGGTTPWPPDNVRAASKLASEPNLLAWYVGDDIGMQHLDGIRQTVGILREETPSIPTVADYIAERTPEAKTVFTEYVDIRCQYEYPVFHMSLGDYSDWFDRQREWVGDPLWTWTQCFMWGNYSRPLFMAQRDGPGPLPEPEQVRLMSFLAINRGIRGLLFFSHYSLLRQPELAGEVALLCREVRVFNDALAAGAPTYGLATSDPELRATSFTHGTSAVIAALLLKPFYHRWVDEGVVRNVTIECPWEEAGSLPTALLVAMPDAIECGVERIDGGRVRVTVPSLELAGFIVLSADDSEIARVRREVAAIPATLERVMVGAAAAQTRKANAIFWQTGWETHGMPNSRVAQAARAVDACTEATFDGEFADAVGAWRQAMRITRTSTDSLMQHLEARKEMIPPQLHKFLTAPYTVHNIKNWQKISPPDEPWHYIAQWQVTGPFPLGWDGTWQVRGIIGARDIPTLAAGFDMAYGPELDPNGPYDTIDGRMGWTGAAADVSAMLDFAPLFRTYEDVVCYARATIVAPRDMDVTTRLGSNDGAKVWINGENVFRANEGRDARPDQNTFTIGLNEGPNAVLVKVSNLGGKGWKLFFSLDDAERELAFEIQ